MIVTEAVVIASFYPNTRVLRILTSCGNVTISVKILAQNSKHSNPYYILKPTYKNVNSRFTYFIGIILK
jgi:hypothetical protein